jgi:hypothetical protein
MTTASDLPEPKTLEPNVCRSLEDSAEYLRDGHAEYSLFALMSTFPEALANIYAALYVIAQNTAPKTDA